MKKTLFLLILLITNAYAGNRENLLKITDLKRIAFGSCSDQKDPQPLWADIKRDDPDLFIHGGDNIYADTDDVKVLENTWKWLLAQKDYAALRTETPVLGVWDDHDFGKNDSDGNLKYKKESQQLFLDFMEEPKDSQRRIQEGIYTSHTFGENEKKIKFIILDNRYFRNLEKTAPLIGEKQWAWLESELKASDASLNFIVSGLSVLSPKIPYSDAWSDYPEERTRLLKLLKKNPARGIVFLSGDKHFASIFRREGHLEFLSSGMTHLRPKWMQPLLSAFYPNSTHKLNYGLIDISWVGKIPTLRMFIKTKGGKTERLEVFTWKENSWKSIKD